MYTQRMIKVKTFIRPAMPDEESDAQNKALDIYEMAM